MEKKEEALKSRVAVRCAKAAFLLSSLKPLPNSTADHHHQVNNLSLSLSLSLSIGECSKLQLWLIGKEDAGGEDGTGEGAAQEQEDQAMCSNRAASWARFGSLSFHFLLHALSQSDRAVIAICAVPCAQVWKSKSSFRCKQSPTTTTFRPIHNPRNLIVQEREKLCLIESISMEGIWKCESCFVSLSHCAYTIELFRHIFIYSINLIG